MHREDRFDAFYASTRRLLLHQAFALTGDLPAAQSAVRDAYVEAWHHWRKVSRLDDPLGWVRPRAWAHAQRRHTARIGRRNKGLSDHDRTVLDALAKLPNAQRRAFLLVQIAGLSLQDAARELGVTQEVAARQLQGATAGLASSLDVGSAHARLPVEDLGAASAGAALPRASIVRRAGRKRRQSHLVAATFLGGAVALGSGAVAYAPHTKAVAALHLVAPPTPAPTPGADLPTATQLLTADQISRLGLGQHWSVQQTGANTTGNGINTVCQQARFADDNGLGALVRTFQASGLPARSAVQTIEISRSKAGAAAAYRTALRWYAGCELARLQLLRAYQVDYVGDGAEVLVLRVWSQPVTTYTVALARIGAVNTTTVGKTVGGPAAPIGQLAQSLADSVAMLCGRTGSSDCQMTPTYRAVPPPPSGEARGILAVEDLPPVGNVDVPWVGTKATSTAANPSETTCDRANFTAANAASTRSRTYLLPEAQMPARFGLSETYGVFDSETAAKQFVTGVRHNVATCHRRNLSTNESGQRHLAGDSVDAWTWKLTTRVQAHQRVHFRIAFVRHANVVAELTFVSAPHADVSTRAFGQLALRAADRLREL